MTLLQAAALFYLCFYYFVLLGFRAYLLYKRTGINPIKNMQKDGLAGFVERIFAVVFILISVIVLNFVFIEQNYHLLVPIEYMIHPLIGNVGVVLGLAGILLAFIAQLQMGDSWRLGINTKEKTTLITKGLYQFSRNPVYLGVLISYVGFFMMMPNAFSLCMMVLGYFALEIKIRLEENYLKEKQGEIFLNYTQRVRRWI